MQILYDADQVPFYYGPGVVLTWLIVSLLFFIGPAWEQDPARKKSKKLLDNLYLIAYFSYGFLAVLDLYSRLQRVDTGQQTVIKYDNQFEVVSCRPKYQADAALFAAVHTTQNYVRSFVLALFFTMSEINPLTKLVGEGLILGLFFTFQHFCVRASDLPYSDLANIDSSNSLIPDYKTLGFCLVGTSLSSIPRYLNLRRIKEDQLAKGETTPPIPKGQNEKMQDIIWNWGLGPLATGLARALLAILAGTGYTLYDAIRNLRVGWQSVVSTLIPASQFRLTDLSQAVPLLIGLCAVGHHLLERRRASGGAKGSEEDQAEHVLSSVKA